MFTSNQVSRLKPHQKPALSTAARSAPLWGKRRGLRRAKFGHRFRPRFYCPDRQAPAYHIFETEALYVDNLNGLYTFCPEHTYTTYDLVESAIGNRRTLARFRARWRELSNVLLFRLALTLAPLRVALETLRRITWHRLFPGPR